MVAVAAITVSLGIAEVARAQVSCLGEIATMTGTPGNDVLVGWPGNDVINGLGGK